MLASERRHGRNGRRLPVALSLGRRARDVTFAAAGGRVLLSTHLGRGELVRGALRLRAGAAW